MSKRRRSKPRGASSRKRPRPEPVQLDTLVGEGGPPAAPDAATEAAEERIERLERHSLRGSTYRRPSPNLNQRPRKARKGSR